jgi:uncharacterized protein (TIGR02145 family)
MVLSKALLTGFVGVSLCMANISGIVKDSAGVGIAGAIVKLEKGGQLDTTESNGSFILSIGTTGSNSQINQAQLNKLTATMHNGMLCLNIAAKSVIVITTFDLNGKALSNMYRSMVAGSHNIALLQRGAGIYLYKVKVGNNEFVLKGNSVGRASSGSAVAPQASFSNSALAKQSKATAAINDVIVVTQKGLLIYRQIVTNSDTSGIEVKMIASAGTVTDMDGNVYQTVRIGNQVWTVDNFRATKYNDGSSIPFVTDSTAWAALSTPGYCYYGNSTNADSANKYGALYNWYAVDTKKLAPSGWHVPDTADWNTLQDYLISNGYNWDGTTTGNKIAKAMAAKADWASNTTTGAVGNNLANNNNSGFSALPGGTRSNGFSGIGVNGFWWSATPTFVSYNACYRNLLFGRVDFINSSAGNKKVGWSVRLIKD